MLQHMYSGYREKLECEAGFNLEVQSQLEFSFASATAQLILTNVCFLDYFYSISCYLSWISDSLLTGFKPSCLWVATQMKSRKPWVKLQKFSIATVDAVVRIHIFRILGVLTAVAHQLFEDFKLYLLFEH